MRDAFFRWGGSMARVNECRYMSEFGVCQWPGQTNEYRACKHLNKCARAGRIKDGDSRYGSEVLPGEEPPVAPAEPHSMVCNPDFLETGNDKPHCKFDATVLVTTIVRPESAVKGLLHSLVCGVAIQGNCPHPCTFGRWSESLARALQRMSDRLLEAVPDSKRKLVLPSRDSEVSAV